MHRTRAKFYVKSVTATAGGSSPDQGSIELAPVTRGAANAKWAAATPSGEIKLFVSNPSAWRAFRDALGKELYVDFTDVPPESLDPAQHAFSPEDSITEGTYGFGCCGECGQPEAAHQ